MLIATKLLASAERETVKEKLSTLPRVERASAKLAAAFQIVLRHHARAVDADTGEVTPDEVETLEAMWAQIEAVVPRHELAAAVAAIFELTPPLGLGCGRGMAGAAGQQVRHGTAVPDAAGDVVDFERHRRGRCRCSRR